MNKISGMAGEDPRKSKAVMDMSEEVALNGKKGLGARLMERGGSSRDRGDLYRTPAVQGTAAAQRTRHGGVGAVVAPVFPVSMGA